MNRKTKICNLAEKSYVFIISYIFFTILAALLFMAAFSTTFIDKYEMPYFLPDNPLLNLAFVFVVMLASVCIYRQKQTGRLYDIVIRIEQDETFFFRIKSGTLWLIWFLNSLWVVCTQIPATGDQRAVLLAAQYIAQGNFDAQGPVSYIYVYNNQAGIVMLAYFLNRIFGEFNVVAYQLLNAICIVFISRNLSEISGYFGVKNSGQLGIIMLCMVFLPLSLYSSFIYGTIPGLLFALCGIKCEVCFFYNGEWKNAVISSLCIAFAVLIKMNYLIFMVAMIIYAVVKIFAQGNIKQFTYLLLVFLLFLAQAKIPTMTYEKISGKEIPQGVSKLAWVTMGLQDGERPGWYNGYSRYTFEASEYNVQQQETWMKTDLKLRLQEMWNEKDAARDFFARKTASQWNDPAFEYFTSLHSKERDSMPEWARYLISEQGNYALTQRLNYLNFIILSGAMLYLLLCSKSEYFQDSLIFAMIIIGGFLFHLVWEAKSQYTLPYFVLLLPYTVMGYSAAAEGLSKLISGERKTGSALCVSKKEIAVKLVLLAAGLLMLWYVFHGTMGSLTSDTEKYMNYLARNS